MFNRGCKEEGRAVGLGQISPPSRLRVEEDAAAVVAYTAGDGPLDREAQPEASLGIFCCVFLLELSVTVGVVNELDGPEWPIAIRASGSWWLRNRFTPIGRRN